MSEPISRPRSLTGEPDHRVDTMGAPSGSHTDPLAELARLVGRDDPFRDIFPRQIDRPSADDAAPWRDPHSPARFPVPADTDSFAEFGHHRAEPDGSEFDHTGFDHHRAGAFDSGVHAAAPVPGEIDPFDDIEQARFGGPAAYGEAPPLNADLWAQGMPEPVATEPLGHHHFPNDAEAAPRDGGRRTLVVLAAVLALTAGGLGTTFLLRGGSHAASVSGELPTILADTSPTKVHPPETSNADTGGDGTTALLEKSASDNVASAKVVNTQERPIDLAQLPSAPAVAPAADDGRVASSSTVSPFPEPKKVKTIMIRPDGSVIGDAPAASTAEPAALASAAGGVSMPNLPDPGSAASLQPADPVAKPSTPKTTARVASTPKATATPTETAATGVKANPPVRPVPAKPKPTEVADATPAPPPETTATTGGGFAVQLAAPTTEKDAKDVLARLQKKFSDDLGSYKPSIRKADAGGKTVFRVRVSNLSQDDAKGLCTKLQASGGSCFVARN